MLCKAVCEKCNAVANLPADGWYCLKTAPSLDMPYSKIELYTDWVTPNDRPPKECPFKFEHAIFGAVKKKSTKDRCSILTDIV